ncbi:HD domain-containing protein [Methanosphaera sp. ISO3-F5]|uniref:HD domain-containing protein n=1 Tax=Methanosphaera sp. ISO3-F5 TaxID=1452353 RepID=UPI002B25E38D|nr:HD domain-containing protein [Methanosphaera sp. ISO3-F5]WQH63256.1 HD domain-containing protein [Methanosphaera sp. ISO3-F5]
MGFIRDSIHGDLHLTDFELKIIDTVEMQRLRRIKQLGFTNLVYPGANHTRFEHSIGTLYLANKVGQTLGLDNEVISLLRVCGLLHDIGHSPFSHVSEKALKHKHEYVTKEIIANSSITDIIEEQFDVKLINNIVDGKTKFGKIISGDLDVDRMDYLARDSYYTGVAYGVIDTERLIYSLTYNEDKLVLTPKGVQAAESTLLARYFMYPTVYQHHTTRIVNSMFKVSLSRLLEDGTVTEEELRYLDDGDLINITRNTKGLPEQTMKNLDTRQLYKKTDTINLAQFNDPSAIVEMDEKYLTEAEEEIAKKLDIKPEEVIIDMPEELSYKKMNVQVETSDGLKPLTEVSTIIDSLKKAQYNYADLALFMSPKNKEKAISKNIKLEDYITLPN